MVPLFLPLHIMEEFIKPLSLACRLFGNVYGEDILLGVGMVLGVGMMLAIWDGAFFSIPCISPSCCWRCYQHHSGARVYSAGDGIYFPWCYRMKKSTRNDAAPWRKSGDPHH